MSRNEYARISWDGCCSYLEVITAHGVVLVNGLSENYQWVSNEEMCDVFGQKLVNS